MQVSSDWAVDRNGDGYPDDATARLVVDLPERSGERAFWAALIDAAARIGLETHALPMPLVVAEASVLPDGAEHVTVTEIADLPTASAFEETRASSLPDGVEPARCLTRLCTIDGALLDRDGDRLPDASRIALALPDELPTPLGVALANLAARLGVESGGLTFPLVREAVSGAVFDVRPGDGAASLRRVPNGWLAGGEPEALAALIEQVAATWPHVTAPETGGVASAVATLRRWLAGDGPEPNEPGEIIWQRDWEAAWEVDRLIEMLAGGWLEGTEHLTVFVSEPLAQREALAQRVKTLLAEYGCPNARVTVLCSFKFGLCWLREVVIPALAGLPVSRVRISYPPLRTDGPLRPEGLLDMPIRWLQELFPGNELLAEALRIPLEAVEMVKRRQDRRIFTVEAFDEHGGSVYLDELGWLSRYRPFVAAIPDSGTVEVTTGGVYGVGATGRGSFPLQTDLETFWDFWQQEVIPELLRLIEARGGAHSAAQPFFGELLAEVWISEPNEPVGVREENDSAAEALAEDIYFTTLDAIEMYGRAQTGERCNAPGAVIPLVRVTPGQAPRARVTLRAAPERPALPLPAVWVDGIRRHGDELAVDVAVEVDGDSGPTLARLRELAAMPTPDGASISTIISLGAESVELRLPLPSLLAPRGPRPSSPGPPMDTNIHGDDVMSWATGLATFPEVTSWVEDHSYQGRPLVALSLAAPTPGRLHSPMKAAIFKPTYLVVARHHANEISSTNAAFRLAWLCATDPEWRRYLDAVNVLILPYENPDGAALHARLAAEPGATTWKHHPARYNALGYEFGEGTFDPDTRFGEARVRRAVWERWPADAIVDNHGVPSHEWVQPFAGFGSPPRFGVSYWIPQALLYGIARWVDAPEYPEHRAAALALRDAVSAIVRDTDIGDWNRVYGASYRQWGQSRLPDRFPGEFHDDMLWHIDSAPPDPQGRGFATRFPKTTVLSWVTEVNDETAEGEHLERVARAHLLANRATLDLLLAAAPPISRWRTEHGDGTVTLRVGRARPLRLG
ncbi:MAG TPA: M14 family metallopeptidase [Thermomicrobiales bacterium]|nr:M14 family metallopeptidase [Thermomicrobiales bacterium]